MFPIPIEITVTAHPEVKSALVIGSGKSRPALLVEHNEPLSMADHASRAQELIEQALWSIIYQANKNNPPECRLDREMILVLGPDRAMRRTTKGYVSRNMTEKDCQAELGLLYGEAGSPD